MWKDSLIIKQYSFNTFRILKQLYKGRFKYNSASELEKNISKAELLHLIGLVNKPDNSQEVNTFCEKIGLIDSRIDMYI